MKTEMKIFVGFSETWCLESCGGMQDGTTGSRCTVVVVVVVTTFKRISIYGDLH